MKTLIVAAIRCSLVLLVPAAAYAISAQWDLDPISGDWNTAANWTPNGVPNGTSDIATFGLSNTSDVSISANTEVNSIVFTPAATNPYTITASPGLRLTISGTGITNNSGVTQNFVTAVNAAGNAGAIRFINSATAGGSTIFTNNGGAAAHANGGSTQFFGISNAGSGTFINNAGAVSLANGGFTEFFGTSNADSGTFINNGGKVARGGIAREAETVFFDTATAGNGIFINNGGTVQDANGGVTLFGDSSTAGSGTFTNNGGAAPGAGGGGTGFGGTSNADSGTFINHGGTAPGAFGGATSFDFSSTAGSATLIANVGTNGGEGGAIFFGEESTGGTSRVEVFGNGYLDITKAFPGVAIGSIEGDGNVFLSGQNLSVGSNNMDTTFAGVIQERVFRRGSLTKIGTGTLDLTGANTYTGDTNINRGVLQVDGSIASNTFVNRRGTLAGTGTINGNVTNNGRVSPGSAAAPGMLTVTDNYTQTQFATLMIQLAGTNAGEFSVLNVLGNANLNGFLDPMLLNGFAPTIGDSFTFLNYASFTGEFSHIKHPFLGNGLQWSIMYETNQAILTVEQHVPDQVSTLLLLMLGVLGLVTFRKQLVHKQS